MRKPAALALFLSLCIVSVAPRVTAGGVAAAGAETHGSNTNAVILWNVNAADAALAACIAPDGNPLFESRLYATMHLGIHDALNAIHLHSRPYLPGLHAERGTSPKAAVAAAARDVLVTLIGQLPLVPSTCIDAGVASVEADYAAALGVIQDGAAKAKGIALGQAAAAAILAERATDGAGTTNLVDPAYPQGTEPGEYRFTPPSTFAFAPGWGDVTPFVLRDSEQFRPGPPDPVTSSHYTADFREVKRLGGDDITTPSARTTQQTEVALFWLESSPLMWNRIARTVSVQRGLGMWKAARLFGLLNMALADGYIGTFDTKYFYNYWRPITAIREAGTDGNPHTAADATWTPLVPTPPIPDYDSGHAVEGGAGAQVLRRFFGNHHITFRACSFTLPAGSTCADASPVFRRFFSFTQAERENGISRILVGFHFRTAVDVGIAHGRRIGDRAVNLFLRPV
jgi:hypothetical protein